MLKIHVINPFDTRRLKHPNYNITQWFNSKKIEYVDDEHKPDWIIIHVLWGGYLIENTNILNTLSVSLKQRLQQGKTGLLVWYPYETEHYRNENVVAQIEGMDGTNHDNYLVRVLVTGNLNNKDIIVNARKELKEVLRNFNPNMHGEKPNLSILLNNKILDTPETTVVPLLFFDWQLITHLKQVGEANQIIPDDWFKWDKKKSFMCLNGKDKKHRRHMLNVIYEHELEEHGSISYVCYDGIDSTLNNDAIGGDDLPIILDQSIHQVRKNDRYMNPELYNNCWINIVTEAFPHVEQDLFITEKTFKPMLQLQPFLIQGNQYTLKKLQEFGFKTFPTLFDESYDNLPTVEERTEAIGIQLSKWCKKTYKKEMVKSVWDDLLHNQQMLLNTELDLTRSAYLAEILKAVSVGG